MLCRGLGQEVWKTNDELPVIHSERFSFMANSIQEVEHQYGTFALGLVLAHRKIGVFERVVQASCRLMSAYKSGAQKVLINV